MPGRSLWRLAGFFFMVLQPLTVANTSRRDELSAAAAAPSSTVALPGFWLFGNAARLPTSASQWWVLVWLGMVASGLGLYWWNNALVSAELLVNLLLCNRDADLWRLSLGGALIASSLLLTRVGSRQLYVAKEMR